MKKNAVKEGTNNFQQEEKASLKYFFKSFKYILPYKWMFVALILGCLLSSALSAVSPHFTEQILTGFTSKNWQILLNAALMMTALTALRMLVNQITFTHISYSFEQKVALHIQSTLLKQILNLKNKNFDKYGSGKYINTVQSDTKTVGGNFVRIFDLSSYSLGRFAAIIYIFVQNVWLGLYCLVYSIIICVIYVVRLRVRERQLRQHKKNADDSTSILNEVIRGNRDIKNYNIQNTVVEKTYNSLSKTINSRTKINRTQSAFTYLANVIEALLDLGYIGFAILLIKYNITTFEIAFTVYVFKNSFASIFTNLVRVADIMQDGAVSTKRIEEVEKGSYEGFEDFPEKSKFGKLPEDKTIEIKELNFSYMQESEVLKKFSIKVPQGQKIALVGESGSGKSTILKLLNKSYDVERGKIFIGGQDICDYSKDDLRNMITIVPQDPYIFNFTIRENLQIIKPDATDQELDEACKRAQIYEYIQSLPEKYETKLGEGGLILSGGQKQRLAIARALLKESQILIFDEATSALDNENQAKIKQVIDKMDKSKTVIIVAHRLSTIVDADVIYYMKDGKIIANGTHKQLLKKCQEYRQLYQQEI